jgi:hypothetical protein
MLPETLMQSLLILITRTGLALLVTSWLIASRVRALRG